MAGSYHWRTLVEVPRASKLQADFSPPFLQLKRTLVNGTLWSRSVLLLPNPVLVCREM